MMLSEMATSVTELHARWASEKNQLGHIKVEMKRWFGDVTLNMLLKVIIGKRCVGPNAKGDEKEAIDLQMAIRKSFHLMGEGMLRDYIPILANLGFDRHGKAMEKIAIRIDSILQSWLQEHRRNTDKNQSLDTKDGDFMDSLLSLCRSNELPSHFDHDTIVKATTLVLSP